jgi:4-diphosphocytidyl-2-C-methyl-D-erythritol kinase
MTRVTVEALAKVNLGLYVLYRRPDDFHELRTVFQTISLADRLEVAYGPGRRRSVELICNRPELTGPENLAARAAARLLETLRTSGRVEIRLDKRIPVGAGLGGGSSDAAAVLQTLAVLLRPRPPRPVLFRVAAELGSDVPFFLLGGRAVGLGRGTEVYPLPDSPVQWMVVAAPPVFLSTAEAYRRLSPKLTPGRWEATIHRFCSSICAESAKEFGGVLENDFEPVVFQMHPELGKLKTRLQRAGARPALLCGSGAAMFGVCAGRRAAVRVRDSLELAGGGRFVVHTVTRTAYQARWRRWLGEEV